MLRGAGTGSQPRPAFASGRVPLLALGALSLLAGIWSGLLRMGVPLLVPSAVLVSSHGTLMICGFLGTVIGLERAVALERWWAYSAPLLTGVGSVALLLGVPTRWGSSAILAGSLIFLIASATIVRRQPASFTFMMAVGAVTWVLGNGLWWAGHPVFAVVWWWAAFLLLTIVGERLELGRLVHRPRWAAPALAVACISFVVGVVSAEWRPDVGARIAGAGMVAVALWLAFHDVARRTVRHHGLPRYVAACLLSGYAWLLVSGATVMRYGAQSAGLEYDAALHAFFVGFVFSMIFGHGPIIIPAVLRVKLRYRPLFYGPLALLHVSLVLRIVGDLGGIASLRLSGGVLNAVAIVAFIASMAFSVSTHDPAASS